MPEDFYVPEGDNAGKIADPKIAESLAHADKIGLDFGSSPEVIKILSETKEARMREIHDLKGVTDEVRQRLYYMEDIRNGVVKDGYVFQEDGVDSNGEKYFYTINEARDRAYGLGGVLVSPRGVVIHNVTQGYGYNFNDLDAYKGAVGEMASQLNDVVGQGGSGQAVLHFKYNGRNLETRVRVLDISNRGDRNELEVLYRKIADRRREYHPDGDETDPNEED